MRDAHACCPAGGLVRAPHSVVNECRLVRGPQASTCILDTSDDDAQRANDAWTGSWPKEGTNHLDPLHAVWLTLARIGSDEPAAARWY
jgi:hypothetical protein